MEFTINFMIWVGAISAMVVSLLKWLKAFDWKQFWKFDDEELDEIDDKIDGWVDDGIDIVDQVFVSKLKATGAWDSINGVYDRTVFQRNATQACQMCVQTINHLVPTTVKKRLAKSFDDRDMFFRNRIEQRLQKRHVIQ